MKKTILLLSAMAVMTACSNDETLEMTTPQAITFSNAFVENSTRAAIDESYKKETLESFEVYGTITNTNNETANLFNKETVSKEGNAWTYDENNTQYWIPNNTYQFTAIADGNETNATQVEKDENGMPTKIKLLDASKQNDILLATTSEEKYTSGEKTVAFTFTHLMAKAKFTVKNAITTDNGYTYKVSNIQMVNATKEGVYAIESDWENTVNPATYNLSFGHIVETANATNAPQASHIPYNTSYESNWERLIVPATSTTINVSFTKELYKNEVLVDKQENIEVQADAVEIKAGHAYNFVITLGNPGEPIKFTVQDINEWETNHNDDNVTDEKDNIMVE